MREKDALDGLILELCRKHQVLPLRPPERVAFGNKCWWLGGSGGCLNSVSVEVAAQVSFALKKNRKPLETEALMLLGDAFGQEIWKTSSASSLII